MILLSAKNLGKARFEKLISEPNGEHLEINQDRICNISSSKSDGFLAKTLRLTH